MPLDPGPLQAVVALAQQVVPALAGASITVVTDTEATTRAASPAWVEGLDLAQYDVGRGPCVDAAVGGEICEMRDASTETRWPLFVAAALMAGAGSSMSVPIPVDDGLVGSLNVFARAAGAFGVEDREALIRLAAVAAAALSSSSEPGKHPAFPPRAVVDQAKGILMHSGLSAPEALDALGTRAHASGQSTRQAAEQLVLETSRPRT